MTNNQNAAGSSAKNRFSDFLFRHIRWLYVLLTVIVFISAFAVSSGTLILNANNNIQKDAAGDFSYILQDFESDTFSLANLKHTYTLPIDGSPGCIPNEDLYFVVTDSDLPVLQGKEVLTYKDETIEVTVWAEYINEDVYNFAEVKIAHASQIRRELAGNEYGKKRYLTSSIAESVNAVVAVNGDYYSYRSQGICVSGGVLYRNNPTEKDILLVDDNGDFHCFTGKDFPKSTILEDKNIMFALTFGPILVQNSTVTANASSDTYSSIRNINPRSAIGQIGELHYLICVVEGRFKDSNGALFKELGQVMLDKGCHTAYNLDGGQSSTLYFNHAVYNRVSNGGERPISDIIYFASAVPNED